MTDSLQTESTLVEHLSKLPPFHLARRQFDGLLMASNVVLADYKATCLDNHGLKKLKLEFDYPSPAKAMDDILRRISNEQIGTEVDVAPLAQATAMVNGMRRIETACAPGDPKKVITAIHGETLRRLVIAAEDVLNQVDERKYGLSRDVLDVLREAVDDVKRELRGE